MAYISCHCYYCCCKQIVLDAGVLWTGAFTIWMQHLTEGRINPYAWPHCKLGRAMQFFCQQYSSSLLVIMAIEKCFALYLPLQTKRFCTVGTAKKISLISAFIFFAFNASAFFIYGTGTTSDGKKVCVFVNVPDGYTFIHSHIDAFLYSFIPLIVMFTANCLIILKFMLAKCKNRHGDTESVNQALSKSAVKGTVMLLTVSFAFFILTAPISIAFSIMDDHPAKAYGVTILLLYLNHSINGVLYSISGSRFRYELKNLFLCYGTEGTTTQVKAITNQCSSMTQSVSLT